MNHIKNIIILLILNQNTLSLIKVDEQTLLDEENEKRNREGIISSFALFISDSDPIEYLKEQYVDLKDYTKEDIKTVLKYQKIEKVNSFIELLIEEDLLLNSISDDPSY